MTDDERVSDPLAAQPRISCVHLVDLIDYFVERRGVSPARLVEGLRVDASYLKDAANWADNYDTYRLYRNCHRATPGLTHRDWFDIGQSTYLMKAPGYLRAILTLLSADVTYRGIPLMVPRTSRLCEYGLLKARAGRVCLSFRVPDRRLLTSYTIGTECWYDLGVFSSLPKLQDHANGLAVARHSACCMPIGHLLENCYDLQPSDYRYDEEGVSIRGELAGEWIRLEEASTDSDSFSPRFSRASRAESNAVVVVRDVDIDGRRGFSSGEIYDAPHCIFDLTFSTRSFLQRILSIVGIHGGESQQAPAAGVAEVGERGGPADSPSGDLTPRESEIARLVCLGMKNAEIARELFVSTETVKRHLSNIYVKLEVSNRVQLARTLGWTPRERA